MTWKITTWKVMTLIAAWAIGVPLAFGQTTTVTPTVPPFQGQAGISPPIGAGLTPQTGFPQAGVSLGGANVAVTGGIGQTVPAGDLVNPGLELVPGGINQFVPGTTTTDTGNGTTDGTATTFFDLGGGDYTFGARSTLDGWANLMRARAIVPVAVSQAAVNYSVADRNFALAAQEWYSLESAAWAARASFWQSRRLPPPTAEQIEEANRRRLPERLSPGELDLRTGSISWPSVLMEDEFTPLRSDVDQLLSKRSTQGELSAREYLLLDETIDLMQYRLSQRIRQWPTDLWISANSFLNSLAYEATLSPAESVGRISKRELPKQTPARMASRPADTSERTVW